MKENNNLNRKFYIIKEKSITNIYWMKFKRYLKINWIIFRNKKIFVIFKVIYKIKLNH